MTKEKLYLNPRHTKKITIICNGCQETHKAEIYANSIPYQINTVYQLCDNCKLIRSTGDQFDLEVSHD